MSDKSTDWPLTPERVRRLREEATAAKGDVSGTVWIIAWKDKLGGEVQVYATRELALYDLDQQSAGMEDVETTDNGPDGGVIRTGIDGPYGEVTAFLYSCEVQTEVNPR